jgi:hydroxymethylpyrimidine pyrophosphatase-like HAD family hydrolase
MTREVLSERLQYQEILAGTRIMHGPEAWEIAFHSSYNKSTGIRILCDKLALAIGRDDLIYAGDDENDALAMTAVASLGGLNIAVGNQSFYPDSFLVAGPQELAALCRELSVGSLRK